MHMPTCGRQDQDLCRVQCASLSGNFSAAFTCSELCDSIKMLRPLPSKYARCPQVCSMSLISFGDQWCSNVIYHRAIVSLLTSVPCVLVQYFSAVQNPRVACHITRR